MAYLVLVRRLMIATASLCVAGCSGARPATDNVASGVPTGGSEFVGGTVVAVRQIDLSSQNGSRVGYDDVLSALQQNPPAGDFAAGEVVIRRSDGAAISLPDRGQDFTIGANVAVIEGNSITTIHHD